MKKHLYLITLLLLVQISYLQAQCNVSNISSNLTRGYRMQGSGTTQFTATSTNGTLSWSIAAGASTISSSGLANWDPAFSGTATISVTSSGSCGTPVTKSTNIQVYPIPTCVAPSVNSTSSCGGTGTLGASTYAALVTGHRWYTTPTGGTPITPTTNYQAAPSVWSSSLNVTGNTTVTYYVSSVCGSSETARIAVTYTPKTTGCRLSAPEELEANVSISPNPVINEASITYKLEANTKVTLEVFDSQGKKVATILKNSTKGAGVHTEILDAKKLGIQSKLLIVKIHAGNKVVTKRIIAN